MDFLSASFTLSSKVCSVLLPSWRLSRLIREIPAESSSISFGKHQHQLISLPEQSADPGRVLCTGGTFLQVGSSQNYFTADKSLARKSPRVDLNFKTSETNSKKLNQSSIKIVLSYIKLEKKLNCAKFTICCV